LEIEVDLGGIESIVNKLYEAMFLVDSSQAAADWDGVQTRIRNILEKAQTEIASIKKWDERRLAYKINGQNRGTYILCFFRADGQKIREIERNVQLSDQIMRVLVLSAEAREHEIEKDTPATAAHKRIQKAQQQDAQKTRTEHTPAEQSSDATADKTAAEPAEQDRQQPQPLTESEPPQTIPPDIEQPQPDESQKDAQQAEEQTQQQINSEKVTDEYEQQQP